MSLKAKLEAVIYAAEEPVTVAQFAFLFSDEALEWKAEQEAAAAAQAAETAGALPLLDDAFDYLELDRQDDAPAEAGQEAAAQAGTAAEEATGASAEPEVEAKDKAGAEPVAAAGADADAAGDAGAAAVDPEAEAKRQARQRDREIRAILRQLLDELIAEYAVSERGIEIREIAGGYRMATKPEFHDAVRGFVKSLKPPLKLSLPALETLAVIAYKQPVTAPEVNEIRGVDSSGVFGSLLSRKLIATAGRKQVVGRPILYKTTREFLLRFGLKDVSELPSMEEFEKMAALELEEPEMETAGGTRAESGPEFDESAAEEPAETAETSAAASNGSGIGSAGTAAAEPGPTSEETAGAPSAVPAETEMPGDE